MPLPPADAQRQLKHQRSIQVQAYARSDGLWEIDAQVVFDQPASPSMICI